MSPHHHAETTSTVRMLYPAVSVGNVNFHAWSFELHYDSVLTAPTGLRSGMQFHGAVF